MDCHSCGFNKGGVHILPVTTAPIVYIHLIHSFILDFIILATKYFTYTGIVTHQTDLQ